jgi:L-asparaginase
MQRIYLITTGGAIEKQPTEGSFAIPRSVTTINEYLKKLRLPNCDIWLVAVTYEDNPSKSQGARGLLISNLELLIPHGDPIVITHCTDTIVETGLHIKEALPDLMAPIILTVATTSFESEDSDGLQNLTESLFAARFLEPGVFVVIQGQMFPIDSVHKDKTWGRFLVT